MGQKGAFDKCNKRSKLTTRNPLIPNNLLALHTTCTLLGSILTAPSGTSGSVNDRADTNFVFSLLPSPPSFKSRSINA